MLENIFDPLNISAVMRTCDAVGVREVFVLYTREYLDRRGLKLGKKSSGGVFKWTDVYVFEDVEECFSRVRERFGRVLATQPPAPARPSPSLFELDFGCLKLIQIYLLLISILKHVPNIRHTYLCRNDIYLRNRQFLVV